MQMASSQLEVEQVLLQVMRDAKMDELDEWMSDFRAIACVALEDNAQWLEKLEFGTIP